MRLVIRELKKKYGKNMILDDIGYSFEEGIVYGLIGRREAGKTTFFQCISHEIDFDRGTVLLEYDNRFWKTNMNSVGMGFKTPMLPEFLTVYEYIHYFLDMHKSGAASEITEEDCLKLAEITQEEQTMLIRGCSADVKQKLQLVGILVAGYPVILLDEPLRGLEKSTWNRFAELLKIYRRRHIILVATDDPAAAEAVCDEYLLLQNGKLCSIEPEALKTLFAVREESEHVD